MMVPFALERADLGAASFTPVSLLLCLESGSQTSKKGICGVAGFGVLKSAVCFVKRMPCLVL